MKTDYITTVQAAKKWGLTRNRVLKLVISNRIPNCIKIGSRWLIPNNTEKPIDGRTKEYKNKCEDNDSSLFRYPCFEGRDIDSFEPPLSVIESKIKKMTETFHACKFDDAELLIKDLLKEKTTKANRLYILRSACSIYYEQAKVSEFYEYYNKLKCELEEDFPRKKEMCSLIHEVDATIGIDTFFINDFNVDYDYCYHESFLPHLYALCLISFNTKNNNNKELLPYECMCSYVERSNSYVDLQTIHFYLGIEYSKRSMYDEMKYHYRKALELTFKYCLYYQTAMLYYYYEASMKSVLKEFSKDLYNQIDELSLDLHNRYKAFMKTSKLNTIYNQLSRKDFVYVYFALRDYSIKEISGLLNMSESNIGNKYSSIYRKLGIRNKKELIAYYYKSANGKL